jgi:hypothetical protein
MSRFAVGYTTCGVLRSDDDGSLNFLFAKSYTVMYPSYKGNEWSGLYPSVRLSECFISENIKWILGARNLEQTYLISLRQGCSRVTVLQGLSIELFPLPSLRSGFYFKDTNIKHKAAIKCSISDFSDESVSLLKPGRFTGCLFLYSAFKCVHSTPDNKHGFMSWLHPSHSTWNSVPDSSKANRPWRPIGLWDVEAPTFFRQSAHRWRWGCQPYAPTALYPPGKLSHIQGLRD